MRRRILTERNSDSADATIEIAPLIDMVFILLIFYIVSASFVQDAAVTIDRPRSRAAQAMRRQYVPVTVTKGGALYLEGRRINLEDGAALSRAMDRAQTSSVLIRADGEVATWLLLRVMDAAQAAGAESVFVAAVAEN